MDEKFPQHSFTISFPKPSGKQSLMLKKTISCRLSQSSYSSDNCLYVASRPNSLKGKDFWRLVLEVEYRNNIQEVNYVVSICPKILTT